MPDQSRTRQLRDARNRLPAGIPATRALGCALGALMLLALPVRAQDRRNPGEPVFPTVCTQLQAQLTISGGEPSSETAFDTARISSALSTCGAGHAVELVANGANVAFLIGPITIPSGVTLLVDGGVTVFASRNPADYQVSGREMCGTVGTDGTGCKNLITFAGGTGSGLMGYGVIDGRGEDHTLVAGADSGQSWWDIAAAADTGNAAQNNFILSGGSSANQLTYYKITLKNSAMFHVKWIGSGFTAWDTKVITPYSARNTDGIDPAGTDITVNQCSISDGDDNVAVSASSASGYITVSNTHTYSGHGISIGSYTEGGLTNMLVDTIGMDSTASDGNSTGLRIKSADDRGGLVKNVTYQHICMQNNAHPIQLNPIYDTSSGTEIPTWQNIVFRDLHALTGGRIQLEGADATHLATVTFDEVVFDQLNASQITPAPQYLSLTLGPGEVYPALLQQLTGTGVTLSGSAPATSTSARDCSDAFPTLTGELYLTTSSATNLQTASLQGPASFTLDAILQPAMSQVSYGSWTGVPALSQPIQFFEGSTLVGSASLSANGTLAVAHLNSVGSGTHTYTAHYPGDASYPAYSFGQITVNVAAPTSQPAQISETVPASAAYGSEVSFSASVTGSQGTPTGSVTFYADGNSIGVADVDGSGDAALDIPSITLGAGDHSITASYSGDATYSGSGSPAATLAISAAASSTSLVLPGAPVLAGSPLTLTAQVSGPGGAPSDGSVTFLEGATTLGSANLADGSASARVTPSAVGSLTFSATYSGGANYGPSSSTPQTVQVIAPFAISITPEATSVTAARPATATVGVTPAGGFSGAVTLSCTTPSAALDCSLAQSTLNTASSTSTTATISRGASASRRAGRTALPALFLSLGMLSLLRRRRRGLLALLLGIALGATACGSGSDQATQEIVTIHASGNGYNTSATLAVQVSE